MPSYTGTAANDSWTVVNPGTFVLDGLGGTDTLILGTSLRSDYFITQGSDGTVRVDSISGASQALHATLRSIEILVFNNKKDTLDLSTFFGNTAAPPPADTTPPLATISDNVVGTANGNVTYSIAFTEAVTGLSANDFSIGFGSVVSVSGSGTSYSVVVAPTPNSAGLMTLDLNAGAVTDAAGNPNGRATAAWQPYDTRSGVFGTSGNDRFSADAVAKIFDGLGGIDMVSFGKAKADYVVARTATGYSVSDNTLFDSLVNVERVQFTDVNLAFDLDGHAGQAAKILGAVFGPASIGNKAYVGIGLQLLDGGMSYANLMQLALDTQLGAKASNAAVVNLLYTNVVGSAPPAADAAYYVGLLSSGTYTPATLGVLAADTALNQTHIDLVGLAATGLAYTGG